MDHPLNASPGMNIMSLNTSSKAAVTGGAERTMETLLRTLKASGNNVAVLGTSAKPGLHRINEGGITQWRAGISNLYWPRADETHSWPMRRLWHLIDIYNGAMQRPLGMVLAAVQPDVVFVHNLPGWSISAIPAIRKHDIPVIQILHDHYNICANSTMSRAGKNCARQCVTCRVMRAPHRKITNQVSAVVGVSQYILDRHLQCGAYADVPIKRVIHNVRSAESLGLPEAVSLRRNADAARSAGVTRFGFIGNLTHEKGIELLLEAFAAWNNPRTELWVAGTGKPEMVDMLTARYAGPRIRFLGAMEPKRFFTAIDVTVVPSLWQDPFPGVVAESFAFGVPVVASRRGGLPEMVVHAETGLMYEPCEPGALLAAMTLYAGSPALTARLARNARAAAPRFLDVDGWNAAYRDLIDEVVGISPIPAKAVENAAR
jgi:glycosyltransferase involved in cell wall biosynthesis